MAGGGSGRLLGRWRLERKRAGAKEVEAEWLHSGGWSGRVGPLRHRPSGRVAGGNGPGS
jgi:hypothetical protein